MVVSVIIPTYNDWARLSYCLNALAQQSYPTNKFEIIVVNNYPEHNDFLMTALPVNCKVVNESKPGSYCARNNGIMEAKGKLIAFTDSDCIPDEHWISNAVNYLQQNTDVDRIGGRIKLFYKAPQLTVVERYEQVFAFNQQLYVYNDATAVTANMFTYKRSFEKIGLFNEKLMSGGDFEWSKRAQKAGLKIHYVDNAVVNHPARNKMEELVIKARRVGGGQALFSYNTHITVLKKIIGLIYNLRPPVKSLPLIATRGSHFTLPQKTSLFLIRYYLSVITAIEKFKNAQ